MEPVSAIANAVGSALNTVTAFVNKAAQRYGLQKGIEAEGVSFERQKTITLYGVYANDKQQQGTVIIAAIVALAVIGILVFYKRK